MSSSLASGSSCRVEYDYLKIKRQKEPHPVTVLIEIVSAAVEELQILPEDMTTWLIKSKQGIPSPS